MYAFRSYYFKSQWYTAEFIVAIMLTVSFALDEEERPYSRSEVGICYMKDMKRRQVIAAVVRRICIGIRLLAAIHLLEVSSYCNVDLFEQM